MICPGRRKDRGRSAAESTPARPKLHSLECSIAFCHGGPLCRGRRGSPSNRWLYLILRCALSFVALGTTNISKFGFLNDAGGGHWDRAALVSRYGPAVPQRFCGTEIYDDCQTDLPSKAMPDDRPLQLEQFGVDESLRPCGSALESALCLFHFPRNPTVAHAARCPLVPDGQQRLSSWIILCCPHALSHCTRQLRIRMSWC